MLKAYGASGDVAELRQFAQQDLPVTHKHYDQLERDSGALLRAATTADPMKVGRTAQ